MAFVLIISFVCMSCKYNQCPFLDKIGLNQILGEDGLEFRLQIFMADTVLALVRSVKLLFRLRIIYKAWDVQRAKVRTSLRPCIV